MIASSFFLNGIENVVVINQIIQHTLVLWLLNQVVEIEI